MRNDDSVVLEARYDDVSIVLLGDIGQEVEAMVAQSLEEVPFRVVKVPHHGSGGASSPAWIAATRPCVAIVSAGRSNPFGHPVPEVTARYRAAGALVLETGRHGAITLETNGRVVTLRTQTGERFRFQARGDGCGAT
ncbi:MAG: hypothetical protein VYE68_02945 [Acidobacteriota bacterium]|nr:hypothetical protein [Acidobacteriota bacterium]